ncbi:MAG: methionine adenosyltransferase [Puniceicoccaceae bacterium TMED149]|nr:MAG: methionine adenosyltransferase [Puniceicoccaceae bacterium TMED149]|tara:strand:- start:2319 stop:3485 length:1167 start_codon:yes stop_codon:yes gene_type:complete
MSNSFVFSSESVGEGHPDKVADYISDSVLDACLEQDASSRVACECLVKSNSVVLAGEITTQAKLNFEQIVREAIRSIGYVNDDDIFHADTVFVSNLITKQSADIAQGVDAEAAEGKKTSQQGAGDQGIMFGYACRQTAELMPAPVMYAHRILREMARQRKDVGVSWMRPDVKSQVALAYENNEIVGIKNVVVSTQHAEAVTLGEIEDFCINEVIKKVLPSELILKDTEFLINPTGKFVIGGPQGDAGLTGRKIIVDTYGGWARHGGGAFSGKDPSKVDRSAAYFTRWVAKNVVAAGLADSCELEVAYAIGHPYPTSIHIDTFESNQVDERKIESALKEVFDFRPAAIIEQLNLLRPIYRESTHYGHFAKDSLPWEDTSKADVLRSLLS